MADEERRSLPYCEGSFYRRASDGLRGGAVYHRYTASGRRRRATVSDLDEAHAWDKLTALRKKVAAGKAPAGKANTDSAANSATSHPSNA